MLGEERARWIPQHSAHIAVNIALIIFVCGATIIARSVWNAVVPLISFDGTVFVLFTLALTVPLLYLHVFHTR